MSSTTNPLPFSRSRNFFATLLRCAFSITSTMSAHSMRSPLTGVGASALVPAPIALTPGYSEKTRSAVGLRKRFSLQTKSRFMGARVLCSNHGVAVGTLSRELVQRDRARNSDVQTLCGPKLGNRDDVVATLEKPRCKPKPLVADDDRSARGERELRQLCSGRGNFYCDGR